MDTIDQGQAREQELRDAAIEAARHHRAPGTDICIDCDEPIEPERKAANPHARRCAFCQKGFEKS